MPLGAYEIIALVGAGIIDVARGARNRLTFDPGADGSPVWSPDGSRIAFEGLRSGKVYMRQKQVSGTADDEPVLEGTTAAFSTASPSSWSSDGRFIAYMRGAGTAADIWILPMAGDSPRVNAKRAERAKHIIFSAGSAGSALIVVTPPF